MITRRLISNGYFILLLAPTLSWASNETGESPIAQSAPAPSTTVQITPAKSPPIPLVSTNPTTPTMLPSAPKAASAPVATTPASAPSLGAKPAPASPAPITPRANIPASAVITPPLAQKQLSATPAHIAPAPIKPAQTNPVPVTTVPAKPSPAQTVPLQAEVSPDSKDHSIDIEVFERDGCPQCDKAKEFLSKLHNLKPNLKIITRDVRKEPAAMELLKRMALNQGNATLDYPAFVVGGQLIIGFSEEESTAQLILESLATSHPVKQQEYIDTANCTTGNEPGCDLIPPAPVEKSEKVTLSLLGYNVPLLQVGLPLFTVAMGLLDGFNFGSTWVLILMISLLSPLQNRPHMFAIAGTFIATQAIIYFILMSAWLNLLLLIGVFHIIQITIAGLALIAGAIYLKKYMQFGRSFTLSSHEITKPGTYTHIRKIVESPSLAAAMLATIGLAILVQISEFSYTSIFPALYTQVLSMHKLDSLSNYSYLLLYDTAYMLDDIIILFTGIVTLSQSRTQQTESRILKLVSGLTLAGLGAYLLLTS